jgi:hypothetical protein
MRRIICRTLAVLFASSLSLTALAQTAQFQGQVTDPQQAVVVGAEVRIFDQATGVERKVKTNGEGLYTAPFVSPGTYQIYVQAAGFSTVSSEPLTVTVGQTLVFDVHLKVGSAHQEVTVEEGSQMLNTTDASVGTVIDRKFVENIPLNGRSFQDLISMTPGVVSQNPQSSPNRSMNGDFSVNGQRTESNYYMVDGVTANIGAGNGFGQAQNGTGGALGGATALGTTQSMISVDALQEFQVLSSTYSAEYGHSPGGQFSLLTRSGTNTYHGSLFDYLRNNFFDANDWFNDHAGAPTPALRQNDFGGTLGGPIQIPKLYNGKDRSFFFFSYEGLRLTLPTAAAVLYVPDLYMRRQAVAAMQPILNAYPLPNGIDYGTSASPSLAQFIAPYSLPYRIDSTSARVDHTFSRKLSVFFRYGDTPSSALSRSNSAVLSSIINVKTFTAGASSQFSSRFSNDLRLGYDQTDSSNSSSLSTFGGATPTNVAAALGAGSLAAPYPIIYLSISGVGVADLAIPNGRNLGRQWNLVDNFSATYGHHQIKLGIDYRRIKSPLRPTDPELFTEFTNATAILKGIPSVPEIFRFVSATPIYNETGAFLQDEWRAAPNLSVSLGLRWDINPAPTEANGNDAYTMQGNIAAPSSLSLAPQGTPLWKTTWYNFAPRLGVAWTPHKQSGMETVVRAGGGVFYDTLNQVAATGYTGLGFEAYKVFTGATLPYTMAQLQFPISVSAPYTSGTVYDFPAHLQLPYTLQWNVSLQQALGRPQTVTISYVGSNGRRLTGEQTLSLAALNSNFSNVGYFPSGLTSNYQALQLQFQRTLSHGIQALASYTWSHSLDFGSADTSTPLLRGNSDFDLRNNFNGGLSWDLPNVHFNKAVGLLLNNWGLDGRLFARGGFPVILNGLSYTNPSTGISSHLGLNYNPAVPLYVYGPDSEYPGGRAINKAAFSQTATGIVGNAPRNFVRGFGASQVNLAARREFHLDNKLALQFRAETFNILNHPNFGYIDPTYTDATFGQVTKMLNSSLGTVQPQYQQGGSRSMQFALKLLF